MYKQKILALILAGGQGGRLGLLTENKAKPVVAFGGSYRLIDFALSNCLYSKISDVWIIEQYELHSLNKHLANGKPWDLDRTYGGLQVLPPFEADDETGSGGGFARGNADAIVRHQKLIAEFNPDILLVLSSDHIYRIDFRDVFKTHLEKKASVTMVTTSVPQGESASRFGVVKVAESGRITDFEYKPEKPKSEIITTEVFVYDAKSLLAALKELTAGNRKVKDYGDELIPKFVKEKTAYEHRHKNFWRDVGTIKSYWQSQMTLLNERLKFAFDDEDWAILTNAEQKIPAFIYSSASVTNSLIAQGCKVRGIVEHSILSTNVTVEKSAIVRDSVIMPDSVIESGIELEKTIVDEGVTVSKKKLEKIKELRKKYKNDIIVIGKYKIQSQSEIEGK